MSSYFLLFLSVFIDTFKNACMNRFEKKSTQKNGTVYFSLICGVGSIIYFILRGSSFSVSTSTLLFAAAYAFLTATVQYTSLRAMATGPMSYTVLFMYLGSMLIPTVWGAVFDAIPLTLMQIIGLPLMILSIIFGTKSEDTRKKSGKWLFFAFSTFTAGGLIGIVQKYFQNSAHAEESKGMLLFAFLFLELIFFVFFLLSGRKNGEESSASQGINVIIPALICGVIVGAVNEINLLLVGLLPSIVVFPILNGGVISLSAICAFVVFREKLSRLQIIGIFLGLGAALLLSF